MPALCMRSDHLRCLLEKPKVQGGAPRTAAGGTGRGQETWRCLMWSFLGGDPSIPISPAVDQRQVARPSFSHTMSKIKWWLLKTAAWNC